MIVYFCGPEGGGKTVMMTRECRIHHLLGGEIYAFPGYELKNNAGRVVSTTILPHQVLGILDDMQYIVLVIDEISNFMNHHTWYAKMVDIMTYGAAAQRRKRGFVILASGPIFEWLPADLRLMFHEVVNCSDRHWRYKNIPRGTKIEFYREDRRGVLSGNIGTRTKPRIFDPRPYFKYFETFSLVDPKYQFNKIRIQAEEILMDAKGNVLTGMQDVETNPAAIKAFMKQYEEQHPSKLREAVDSFLATILDKGITRIRRDVVWQYFNAEGNKSLKDAVGSIIRGHGAKHIDRTKEYDLSAVALE